jgi:hypothetical protein
MWIHGQDSTVIRQTEYRKEESGIFKKEKEEKSVQDLLENQLGTDVMTNKKQPRFS